jgi:Gpi18-like mannosyltransferase
VAEARVEAEQMRAAADGPRLWITLALAAALYAAVWPVNLKDMDGFLIPWLQHILDKGPVGAFAEPFSNYSPPYLYLLALASPLAAWVGKMTLIKAVSVLGTVWLAWSVHSLLRAAGARLSFRASALILLVPSVGLNAALLGQCDALWTAACVSAVACAMKRRLVAMLVWSGLAFALKAQAAFCAPFIVAVLVAERAPVRFWLIPPAVYVAAMLPAWAAGWPAADLATIYLRQAQWFDALSLSAPNIWMLVQEVGNPAAFPAEPMAFAAAAAAALLYVAYFARRGLEPSDMIAAALLASLLLPGLLPRMHERYFFLADVLSFALAMAARDRPAWLIFAAVQTSAVLSLWSYLTTGPMFAAAASITMIAATLAVAARLGPKAPAPGGGALAAA